MQHHRDSQSTSHRKTSDPRLLKDTVCVPTQVFGHQPIAHGLSKRALKPKVVGSRALIGGLVF